MRRGYSSKFPSIVDFVTVSNKTGKGIKELMHLLGKVAEQWVATSSNQFYLVISFLFYLFYYIYLFIYDLCLLQQKLAGLSVPPNYVMIGRRLRVVKNLKAKSEVIVTFILFFRLLFSFFIIHRIHITLLHSYLMYI